MKKKKDYIGKTIKLYTESRPEGLMKSEFHRWLADKEFAREKDKALFDLWNDTDNTATEETMYSLSSLKNKTYFHNQKKSYRINAWRYAAAIALIICAAGAYVITHEAAQHRVGFTEHFTGAGDHETITLPDGTTVLTNSASIILYPDDFGNGNRDVYLSGEANFKVARDQNPFTVHTKHLSVRALGTEFDVAAYAEDVTTKVTLINGSVNVERKDEQKEYLMYPGEQFVLNKLSGDESLCAVDVQDATAWQRGELVFRGATIQEIALVLERKYGISFHFKDNNMGNDRFNFRFRNDATLAQVLEIIKAVGDVNYTMKDYVLLYR